MLLVLVVMIIGAAVSGFFWYFGSPKYTDVGYRPRQPVKYSHKLHAGDLGLDCRYCHVTVEKSAVATIPPTQICMNCHTTVLPESEKLLPVRESWATGKPIEWVRVHKLGEFAYFDHSIHINRGIGCISCHGDVSAMEVVEQKKPLNMSWCLDCHRNPDEHLRPVSEVTNMKWIRPEDWPEFARQVKKEKKIETPEDCSRCHR